MGKNTAQKNGEKTSVLNVNPIVIGDTDETRSFKYNPATGESHDREKGLGY